MTGKLKELPNDVGELRQMVFTLQEENALLKHRLFGRKSEKLTPEDDKQARLFNEAEAYAEPAAGSSPVEKVTVPEHQRKKRGRKAISEDLPRKEVIHDLPEDERICACGAELRHIGDDVSEELDIIPQQVVVIRNIKRKYACEQCEGLADESQPAVKTAAPARLLPGSIASPGLLAYIFTAKFCDALPFYRQEKIFKRIGVTLSRATMCNWAISTAKVCRRLQKLLWDEIRNGDQVGVDETSVQVLKEAGRKATQKSYVWALQGGDPEHPVVILDYRRTREASFLRKRLRGFNGCTMTDGYSGYGIFNDMDGITPAGCWAHVRRGFREAEKPAGATETTMWILGKIRDLYRIETEIRNLGPPKRKKIRNREARPITEEIFEWLDLMREQVPPGTLLGKAIQYTLNQWPRLIVYLDRGEVPIDNNAVENAIRPFVVGRKNWMFFDRPWGAHAGTFIYSLIETAKANGLEPYWYLRYLFEVFPGTPKDKDSLRQLMPNRVTTAQIDRHFGSRRPK